MSLEQETKKETKIEININLTLKLYHKIQKKNQFLFKLACFLTISLDNSLNPIFFLIFQI